MLRSLALARCGDMSRRSRSLRAAVQACGVGVGLSRLPKAFDADLRGVPGARRVLCLLVATARVYLTLRRRFVCLLTLVQVLARTTAVTGYL